MTSLVGPALLALMTYLVMRRRGRVFLELEEAVCLGLFVVLGLAQRVFAGQVNLNGFVLTPLYLAIPVVVGHARGAARGASASMLGGWALCFTALAFADVPAGTPVVFPLQYMLWVGLMGILGGTAGIRGLPKALKPLLTLLYLLFVGAHHPEYMRSLAPYVVQFIAIAVASAGLLLNPFKAPPVPTIHYPTSPSRRT